MAPPPNDMAGKVVVLTGGNSGIGKETCVALARRGATVLFGARDEAKGHAALAEIRRRSRAPDDRVLLGSLDLASFGSIRAFAADVLERLDRIDVLVNNAGLILDHRLFTDEGHEMTFGVNHLGHFLLTDLLLDRLRASEPARVITVSSFAHRRIFGRLDHRDLESEQYRTFVAYGQSKLANILFTRELARRLAGTGVTANCLHPGFVRSGFGRDGDYAALDALIAVFGSLALVSPTRGARTTVWLASSPKAAGLNGKYVVRRRVHPPSRAARNDDVARWLWATSEQMVAAATDPPPTS